MPQTPQKPSPVKEGSVAGTSPGEAFESLAGSHYSITVAAEPASEIRTKVFRMGKPLLRSTIPLTIGGAGRSVESEAPTAEAPTAEVDAVHVGDCHEDSDIETVLSCVDDEEDFGVLGNLSITFDFPC